MRKQRIIRIVGYLLWALALVVLLPVTLLNTDGSLANLDIFLLFTLMVAMLLVGYVLVDSASDTLRRLASKVRGSGSRASSVAHSAS